MPTTTTPQPNVPLPAGAVFGDVWEGIDPKRVIMGPNRGVTDSDAYIWTTAIQRTDGRIEDGPEPPQVHIEADTDYAGLNSDQCREMASLLLEAAAQLDGWLR
jgi:hypothetical protein